MIDELSEVIEILEFFEKPKKSDYAKIKWGNIQGIKNFNNLLREGDIEEIEGKKDYYALNMFGRRLLDDARERLKKEKRKEFFRHPLFIGIICSILSALFFGIINIIFNLFLYK